MAERTSSAICQRLRRGHEPRTAELDQGGGETGKVCSGHGMGYAPSWPCLNVEAADHIEYLNWCITRAIDLIESGRQYDAEATLRTALDNGSSQEGGPA